MAAPPLASQNTGCPPPHFLLEANLPSRFNVRSKALKGLSSDSVASPVCLSPQKHGFLKSELRTFGRTAQPWNKRQGDSEQTWAEEQQGERR